MTTVSIYAILIAAIYLTVKQLRKARKQTELDIQLHNNLMRQERNKQVLAFRQRLIGEFGVEIIQCMAGYRFMLDSVRPLTAKEWVNVDMYLRMTEDRDFVYCEN